MYETLVFDLAMTRLIAIQRYTDCWHLESFKVLRSFVFVAYYIVFDRKRKFCCLSSDIAVRSEVKEYAFLHPFIPQDSSRHARSLESDSRK